MRKNLRSIFKMMPLVILIVVIAAVGAYFLIQKTAPIARRSKQAVEIASFALGDFQEYDKTTPPVVELRKGIYYVTFAKPKNTSETTRHGYADYAIQIQIAASTGKVIATLLPPD